MRLHFLQHRGAHSWPAEILTRGAPTYLLGVEDQGNLQVLQSVGVDLVVSLGLHRLTLAGNIAGPVTGLEVVTVDQTT